MNDTPPHVAEQYRRLLMERSGAERLRMTCGMFDSARRMVLAGLGGVFASDGERNAALFLRLYGRDFDAPACERIVARILRDGSTVG